MKAIEVSFPGRKITLEGVWHFPDGEGPFPAVMVCHPHPQYGGNMSNYVVRAICEELARRAIAALRFNFRGVGESGGAFGGGIDEQEDVRAAIDFALSNKKIDAGKLGLAGYSFGAGVIVPVALNDERVKSIALVSPVFPDSTWEKLQQYAGAKLLIVGSSDTFIPLARFEADVKTVPQPVATHIVQGADHFWWGYENEVAWWVGQFFAAGFDKLSETLTPRSG